MRISRILYREHKTHELKTFILAIDEKHSPILFSVCFVKDDAGSVFLLISLLLSLYGGNLGLVDHFDTMAALFL